MPVYADQPLATMSSGTFCSWDGIPTCNADFPASASTAILTVTLVNGYLCTLTGWTHTRTYAAGLLQNYEGGSSIPKAVVSGLEPGFMYTYAVYQYESGSSCGTNSLAINGGATFSTTCNSIGGAGMPTATGKIAAKSDGTIVFVFTRISDHVDLSALSIAKRN
jgi:hypothetical protein